MNELKKSKYFVGGFLIVLNLTFTYAFWTDMHNTRYSYETRPIHLHV